MKIADIEVTAIHPERWGDDLDVVNAARVSFNKESGWEYKYLKDPTPTDILECEADGWEDVTGYDCGYYHVFQKLSDKDVKLIQYLAKHKHFSPFNHSFIKMRIKVPIFVARQLVKHKFMPWNEVSRRYVFEDCEFWFPKGIRKRAESLKQGSSEEFIEDSDKYLELMKNQAKSDLELYNTLLDNGAAPEVARQSLPQNLMTEVMWSGTLGAWLDMIKLRLGNGAQKESQYVALLARDKIYHCFPVSCEEYLNAN